MGKKLCKPSGEDELWGVREHVEGGVDQHCPALRALRIQRENCKGELLTPEVPVCASREINPMAGEGWWKEGVGMRRRWEISMLDFCPCCKVIYGWPQKECQCII